MYIFSLCLQLAVASQAPPSAPAVQQSAIMLAPEIAAATAPAGTQAQQQNAKAEMTGPPLGWNPTFADAEEMDQRWVQAGYHPSA